jgi:hypothetical protein
MACGSSGTGRAATSPSAAGPSGNPATSPTPPFTPSEAREAANPDPNFDYGFTVQVTGDGFHPRWLVAICCRPIIWKNTTDATVTVVFDHLGVTSGPIAPGTIWLFTPKNVQSISYHSGADASIHAVLQVNQPIES